MQELWTDFKQQRSGSAWSMTEVRRQAARTSASGLQLSGAAYLAFDRRILREIDETEWIAAGEFHSPTVS